MGGHPQARPIAGNCHTEKVWAPLQTVYLLRNLGPYRFEDAQEKTVGVALLDRCGNVDACHLSEGLLCLHGSLPEPHLVALDPPAKSESLFEGLVENPT